MIIGVIQASSQAQKNNILYDTVCEITKNADVINFGCFEHEKENYSYLEIALEISLLLSSGAVDFIITGSSGQGIMLACNSLPGVICGYLENPQSAYLFGKINDGNAAALPLGMNYGWAGEINLKYTLKALFDEPFDVKYQPYATDRLKADANLLKTIGRLSKPSLVDLLSVLPQDFVSRALSRKYVTDFVIENGKDDKLTEFLKNYIEKDPED